MRISAIAAHDEKRRLRLSIPALKNSLTVIYGPPRSGKTELADLIGHTLFAKRRVAAPGSSALDGEIVVDDGNSRYRLRARHDETGHTRLTIAPMDGAAVDHHTIRNLVGNLSPEVLTPLCAVNFHEPAVIGKLLSDGFRRAFRHLNHESGTFGSRRISELAARRDLLAQELESRIANDRRASKDLEARWRELDRLVCDEQQNVGAAEQRLKAVENSLAETDSRLRYRRLELNVELRWHSSEPHDGDRLAELDAQISHCRQTLAELSDREAAVRGRLALTQTVRTDASTVLVEQQRWLALSRQLAADLTGEVARLARASASDTCVCKEAHPRLRPIAETIERQLGVLQKSIEEQQQAASSAELATELDHLTRAQAELRRQLEHLLDRHQSHSRGTDLVRRNEAATTVFSAADAEQLESRRLELEEERLRLVSQLNSAARRLKVLKAERDAVERERAALLSSRSIEHVQRELAHVQKKLEQASRDAVPAVVDPAGDDILRVGSEYLAQLTDGELNQLVATDHGRTVAVVNRRGSTVPIDMLTESERDQVYLSLCLAYLSAARKHDVWLPLVLDEPFKRLDARGIAAFAAVLDGFCRAGHQAIVFTGRTDAAERMVSIGAEMHDLIHLRQPARDTVERAAPPELTQPLAVENHPSSKRQGLDLVAQRPRRKKKRRSTSTNGDSHDAGHSDAA